MNIISTESVNGKKLSYWFFGFAVAFFTMAVTVDIGYSILAVVFSAIGLLIATFANETVMLSHDVNGKCIEVSTYKKKMVFPLEDILNLTEGGDYGKQRSVKSYFLTVRDNELFGKNIKFTIDSQDIECKDNYYILRGEVIKIRSRRAKERAYGEF